MTSPNLNRVDHGSPFASWLFDFASLALKLAAALLLIALCFNLTARGQELTPAERHAGQAQSANYRVATQSVNGGGGVAKSPGYENILAISQQAPAGLLKSLSFQLELGVLTSDDLNSNPLVIVSAASYTAPIAPGSIATAFGTRLASTDAAAISLPLPTELAGSTVTVNGRASRLFYIGDDAPLGYGQANFHVPEETEEGLAEVVITAADGTRSVGRVQIARVAPGLFTFAADGQGEAAALATADGVNYVLPPFEATVNGQPNFLILFGTGIRRGSHLSRVEVTIDDVPAQVTYAGAQGVFVGLDQINVIIPPQLRGRGLVNLRLAVDGISANLVQIKIR
jgi:uncharacterized protein (TIGR03437 family)